MTEKDPLKFDDTLLDEALVHPDFFMQPPYDLFYTPTIILFSPGGPGNYAH